MPDDVAQILNDPTVKAALRAAWLDSNPGAVGGHEEGGFILLDENGTFSVVRWSRGESNTITVPPHPACKIDGREIVASFHTHPNIGSDYVQEPSETDKRAVRDDPNLKGYFYIGEFVISNELIYRIDWSGDVTELAATAILFDEQHGSDEP